MELKSFYGAIYFEGELGVTGKFVALLPRGHGFKPWKQPLAGMYGQILFKLEWSGDRNCSDTCERGRNTVCISSQVGCSRIASFATLAEWVDEKLSTSEIVEQAVLARRLLSSEVGPISMLSLWYVTSFANLPKLANFANIAEANFL
ncbi:hypothetical protein P3S67_014954 [Capsicum chacoense]